ncbi:MAG: alanyl-tRNA editing protein [Fervidobacterium sp.]|uniref:alanyl-tRNA editing protein n=1 Tax=Fervidobacterium sp. TaxID=1871331 RepID=UPI00404AC4EF
MLIQKKYLESTVEITKVEEKDGKFYAYAKTSPFYPDGKGGQLGDRGKIAGVDVLYVYEKGDEIAHQVTSSIAPGIYEVAIEQKRRKDIAQQHTGQHILSAAFLEIADIETVSFHMGEEYSTIDLDVPFLESEVISESEELANRVIQSCYAIEEIITDIEGSKNYNLRKPLSYKVTGEVRLIEIDNFDVSACGGFHLNNTGEVGLIKVIDTEKVKGNLTRIYAVAGERALKYFQKYNSVLKKLSKMLTSSVDELELRVEKLLNQSRDQALLLSKISQEYATVLSQNLSNKGLVYLEGYSEVGNFLAKIGNFEESILVFYDNSKYIIASKKYDVRNFVSKLIEKFGGKGGGKSEFANYQPAKKLKFEELEEVYHEVYNSGKDQKG